MNKFYTAKDRDSEITYGVDFSSIQSFEYTPEGEELDTAELVVWDYNGTQSTYEGSVATAIFLALKAVEVK